jgi:hypothetical protein
MALMNAVESVCKERHHKIAFNLFIIIINITFWRRIVCRTFCPVSVSQYMYNSTTTTQFLHYDLFRPQFFAIIR